MNKTYDVIIIGGGIIGTATGYYLSRKGIKVLLLEKSFLTSGSTGRCITGIRQQFSTPASINTAMESVRLFRGMKDELGIDVEWKDSGYLFLAHSNERVDIYRKNIEIQRQFGLDVDFIDAQECLKIVPLLDADGLIGGAYCPSDGQANPFLVVKGYVDGIRRSGGTVQINSEVMSIDIDRNRVRSVRIQTGDVYSGGMVVNAEGPWARNVGMLAGIELNVEPERHEALITEGVKYEGFPMLVDYRHDGGYFVQRVTGQFIGCFTPEVQVPGFSTGSTLEFLVEMSRRMCRIVPALESVAVLRQWGGSYCMTPDGNPIVDRTPVDGFFCSVGMCGHGFMLGPALGKYLAHFITEGEWPIPMDEFAFERKFGDRESMA
jgi:sarcosine oxidase subunit beta